LQLIGRLFLALTIIVATAASVAGFLDWRMLLAMPANPSPAMSEKFVELSSITHWLRFTVVGLVALVVFGGSWLLYFLARRHPALLSSPTEFDPRVHESLLAQTFPEPKAPRAKSPKPPKTPPVGET